MSKIGNAFAERCDVDGSDMSDPDPESLDIDFTDRDDVLWFLAHHDVPLPDGLTVEKITDRGAWWAVDEDGFSFRLERHLSPLPTMSAAGSPARWHVRKRYRYDLTTGEWEVTEQHREFRFDPGLLIDAEFDRIGRKAMWDETIDQVQTADDPEATLEEEFASIAEFYKRTSRDDSPSSSAGILPLTESFGSIATDEITPRAPDPSARQSK